MTGGCVSLQNWVLKHSGPREDSPAAFLRTCQSVMSLALDDNHDERHTPVTFCHEFVRRLPLERQGTYTELQ
jgi:hypothetical protein